MRAGEQVGAAWARFADDPFGALLRESRVDFRVVSRLYRMGVLSQRRRPEIMAKLEAELERQGGKPALRANLLVTLIHIGFDEEAFEQIEAGKKQPWFTESWDANFYAGNLYFRYRRVPEAVGYLERAMALHPDRWGRLWLSLALRARGAPGDPARADELFRFGDHMQPVADARFPFREVSDAVGFRRWHLAGAVAFADLDGDTLVDFVGNGVYAHPEIYRQVPGEGFRRQDLAALDKIANVPPACVAADFDNDGFDDLYMTSAAWFGAGPNVLLHNRGGKGFEDVAAKSEAGLKDQNSCGAATLDFDRDGLLDLAVTGTKGGNLRLLRNVGAMRFEDVTAKLGVVARPNVAVGLAVGDVDGDGWPDIFVNNAGPNQIFLNRAGKGFVEEGRRRGVKAGTPVGFAAAMFDYDNDGDMDIMAANFADDTSADMKMVIEGFQRVLPRNTRKGNAYGPMALYRNDGTGHFTNVAKAAGFVPASVMGAQIVDHDLDGDFDVVLGPGAHKLEFLQPLLLYRNDGGDRFAQVAPLDDPLLFGKFHGIAFADIDRDGDPDLYVNNGGVLLSDRFRDLVLLNETTGAHWLHLQLVGTKSNRNAVGAKVRVRVGDRTLHQEVARGQGFSSTNSPYLIFGLAAASAVDGVEIHWPSGAKQSLPALQADQALVVTEGSEALRRVY